MNDGLLEQLLHEGESSCLDYKREQYLFAGASDEEKGELLKDIITFANGWRHADAYILIGIDEVQGSRSKVVGVSHHIPENDLQQFVNTKTNHPVTFSYRAYPFEGKQVAIITIPQQDRPVYLNKDYGKLKKQVVYYRQGTTTAIASPDDIARMGTSIEIKTLLDSQRQEAKKEQVRVTLGIAAQGLFVEIYNFGEIPAYLKEVALAWHKDKDTTMRIPLLLATEMPVSDGRGSVAYVVLGQKNCDLPVRMEARFVLPRFPTPVIEPMATCTQDNVWLSVDTYGGEIHRVPGAEVQPVLVELVKLYRADRGSGKAETRESGILQP